MNMFHEMGNFDMKNGIKITVAKKNKNVFERLPWFFVGEGDLLT